MKRWLAELGIEVNLQPVSDNQLGERTTAGDYDMVVSGWSANPDPDYVLRLQTCGARPSPDGGGLPDTFLCDQRYDELYGRQLAEFDPAARTGFVHQARPASTSRPPVWCCSTRTRWRRTGPTGSAASPSSREQEV